MQLTPRETEKLLVYVAADIARRRRSRGLKLNVPEATVVRWVKQRALPAQWVGGQYRFNRARIAKIADNQITPAHCFAMSAGQIVEDDDSKSAIRELLAHVGANVAGAAAN